MGLREDRENDIRQAYALVREYETILQTSADPREKRRCQLAIAEQHNNIRRYLADYLPLCWRLHVAIPPDIAEIGAAIAVPTAGTPASSLPEPRYVDLDLHITTAGQVTARSPQGEAAATISTRVPHAVRRAVEQVEKREADAALLEELGAKLYAWLFPAPIHVHLQKTEAVARAQGGKVRLRLRIEAAPIAGLPLEFLYRAEGGYFMAVHPDTVLSRYLNLGLPAERVRRRLGPLHMLAIVASPSDSGRLDPREWEAILRQALAGPLQASQITLRTVGHATRREIRDALLQQAPDILQFVGHGTYEQGIGYLALVDETTGKAWRLDEERFAGLFQGYTDTLGLVCLATCESARSDSPQGFLGIAPRLVQRGLPAVIAMQYPVLVRTARIFLEDLYTAIAARKPVDWAVQAARNAVALELGLDNREFATPVLYMRAPDGDIF